MATLNIGDIYMCNVDLRVASGCTRMAVGNKFTIEGFLDENSHRRLCFNGGPDDLWIVVVRDLNGSMGSLAASRFINSDDVTLVTSDPSPASIGDAEQPHNAVIKHLIRNLPTNEVMEIFHKLVNSHLDVVVEAYHLTLQQRPCSSLSAYAQRTLRDTITGIGVDGAWKVPAIKLVREFTSMGLKEAKEYVERPEFLKEIGVL